MTRALQDFFENRDIFNSLELGWELLRILPVTMLGRIKMKTIEKCAAARLPPASRHGLVVHAA